MLVAPSIRAAEYRADGELATYSVERTRAIGHPCLDRKRIFLTDPVVAGSGVDQEA